MDTETQKIAERYNKRNQSSLVKKNSKHLYFNHFMMSERELIYLEIISRRYTRLDDIKFLEIGAGGGMNLFFFKKIGVTWGNIYANELLSQRLHSLRQNFSMTNIIEGDACEISSKKNASFDIIFQSTVFTSILDNDFKQKLADKMWDLLKPGGIIIWYDFIYNNPKNKDVKGINKNEIRKLFSSSTQINFKKVTLAPPIGRRVGKLYPFVNTFTFLRSHVVAVIKKEI